MCLYFIVAAGKEVISVPNKKNRGVSDGDVQVCTYLYCTYIIVIQQWLILCILYYILVCYRTYVEFS